MNNNYLIEVDKISKIYDLGFYSKEIKNSNQRYLKVLDNISFKVKKGERLGIIGGNGAGKSTLLKILSRVTSPSSGQAIIRGTLGSILEIGTGFKSHLSGVENIYLYGSILGYSKSELDKLVKPIIDFSELHKFINYPIETYSSGMKSRLAFSTVVNIKPDILLIDEVLAVGDYAFKQKSIKKFEELMDKGQTSIFVSHSLNSLKRYCDKLIWLDKGKIISAGPTSKIISDYIKKNEKLNNIEDNAPSGKIEIDNEKGIKFIDLKILDDCKKEVKKITFNKSFSFYLNYKITSIAKMIDGFSNILVYNHDKSILITSFATLIDFKSSKERDKLSIKYDVPIAQFLPNFKYQFQFKIRLFDGIDVYYSIFWLTLEVVQKTSKGQLSYTPKLNAGNVVLKYDCKYSFE